MRHYRRIRRLSQVALAARAGLSRSRVYAIEHQRFSVGIDAIDALATALQVPVWALVNDGFLHLPEEESDA